jgi:maltose alpha-D-glucosyltransferase/alpha-amylase
MLTVTESAATGTTLTDDPLWYKDAIIYQAHVKSFFDSTNDGIGDFQGFAQKLDYLQSLGITCLWLLPFFPSPLRDDGYDIADYLNVHPSYGTLEDFKTLVRAAHERGIRVLIELVVNHTSDQHPWFQRARHAPPGSPERAFYVWSDTDKKFPETRIIFCDTEKSNWTYDPVAKQYFWHRFFSHQPDLNHNNPAVVDAVIDVMKFWLDLGVDALRLDAVPYLCVREGTNNENLPETHDVLKRIRREVDAAYPGRMLLAEANQWPADVRPYFGDGDECHMAFHFPLMPRMFMALRQEDRHAITEILNQTPDIPDTSQWALFLRNHDELTLEMVTDEERDYMYQMYAADPQMRLNIGIRRRLAPLVENSRRRIELLSSLLFSLPGTPVVYYGDEIGMGDNIYLGDRNGIRTPMQWSGDRNAGFSRADPARLYAPPVMDAVYGYQAINVEAQERTPFSLLQWMKRLIAMRRQHKVFGRGSLEIIYPANRKVLAFLRRDEHETVLVVANLARTVQPAELDLSAFNGLTPVEMVGQTEFPRITDRPYFLTLGPHTAYWFSLVQTPAAVTQVPPRQLVETNVTVAEALPSLMVGPDWQGVFDSATRTILERQALGTFLKRQRWFGSKGREIKQARFSDWTMLQRGTEPAFATVASVSYDDGWVDSYTLPLALLGGDAAAAAIRDRPACVLARITGARKGAIVDGFVDDNTRNRLFDVVADAQEVASKRGSLRGGRTASAPLDVPAERKWSAGAGDHSNSLAFLGEQFVLKLYRRIEPGPNPELEIARVLDAQGFTRVPALIGSLLYERPDLEPGTLAIVQRAITHQGTAWAYALSELGRFYERISASPGGPPDEGASGLATAPDGPPPRILALQSWFLNSMGILGRRTAELHLALARSTDPAFVPEPLDTAQLLEDCDRMTTHAESVLDLLQQQLDTLSEPIRQQAERVLAARPRIRHTIQSIRHVEQGGTRLRIHGDYHLGQVLHVEEDFVIIDFEGEPARPLSERRMKQSPVRDVAGMMRSFGYAAYVGLLAFTVHTPDAFGTLEHWAETWEHWASHAFVTAYRTTLAESTLLPEPDAWSILCRAFLLDKALYELAYELHSRPDWVRIPLSGVLKLI